MNSITIFIVVMIVLAGLTLSINSASAFKETKSSYSDGYNKGYDDDAIGGFSYYVDPDHTDTYKSGYQNRYRDGIDKSHSFYANTPVVSRNSGSQTLGQNSEIKINGDNNNVKVTQSQAGSQDMNSPGTTTIHDPRTHFYTPQQKQAIENALIP